MTSWIYQPLVPAAADLQAGPPPENTGQIKVWNGSSWVAKPVKRWNGSSWEIKPVKYYNGSTFVTTPY